MEKITDDYNHKCKELDKTVTEMKALVANQKKPSQPTNEQNSSEVKSLIEQLKKEVEEIKGVVDRKITMYFSLASL